MAKKKYKLINDPIHGIIKLTPLLRELIDLPEFQRLQWIKQLGLSFLTYPGGVHTRASHSLGTSYVAGEIGKSLGLDDEDIKLIQVAGLLHDIGHTPFSHVLEPLLPFDHMVYTRDIITGKEIIDIPEAGKIPVALKKYGIDPEEIGALVTCEHENKILNNLIHGKIDADQFDFLLRDAYFCGISHGMIDIYRIIYTMEVDRDRNQLVILEKGLDALEEMFVAREHMYSTIYIHKTGRIAEMMLLRAVEFSLDELNNFYEKTDAQIIATLLKSNPISKKLAERVIFRDLYKNVLQIQSDDPDEKKVQIERFRVKDEVKKVERELAESARLKNGDVIIDCPGEVVAMSEPRLKMLNLNVRKKSGETVPLEEVSHIVQALRKKAPAHTLFAVYSSSENVKKVREACERLV